MRRGGYGGVKEKEESALVESGPVEVLRRHWASSKWRQLHRDTAVR